MRLIKTGKQIGQAVKNVQRLRQIIGVFSKHGFTDVVEQLQLGKFLPSRFTKKTEEDHKKTRPEKLKECFEDLGPTFVKLGQLLSTRPDVIPESYVDQFTLLQDKVSPLSFDIIKTVIERETQKKLEDTFIEFNKAPLASASISQVHEARLHTGERVVVKVQRPGINKIVQTDVSLLTFFASLIEKYIPESRVVSPNIIVDEFFKTLSLELDFYVEANNICKMAQNMESISEVLIPTVYKDLSTHKVLVLEKIEGIRANNIAAIDAAGIDKKHVVAVGARSFFKSVMIDGLFHGDLHGGNIFILEDNRLGIVDFGIVGRLSQRSRDHFANMVMALLSEDYETLCYQYAELGAAGPSIDFDGFQRDVRNTVSPYIGLSLSEVNAGRVLIESTKIATRYGIRVPGDWMMVFKAILTMEGMGKTLDPDFNILEISQEIVKDIVKNQYSFQRISKDFIWIAKDVAALLQVLPRQIRWMFKKFNRNDFAFEIKSTDLQDIRKQLETNNKRGTFGLIAAGFFISGSIALNFNSASLISDYPTVAVVLFLAGIIALLNAIIN